MPERDPEGTTFEIDAENGVLRATGDLNFRVERKFEQACNELLLSDKEVLTLDLGRATYICSSCLGMLFLLQERAKARGKRLHVMVSKAAAPICDMMGLGQLVDLKIAP